MYGHVTITIDAVMMSRVLVITTARRLHLVILVSADVGRFGDIVIIVSLLRQISIGAMMTTNNSLHLDNREAVVTMEAELGPISGIIPPPDHGQVIMVTRLVEGVEGECILILICVLSLIHI